MASMTTEKRIGHWGKGKTISAKGKIYTYRRCSYCGVAFPKIGSDPKFCEECGADMREQKEEGEGIL